MHRCRNPLFCVVPPYVLSEVAPRPPPPPARITHRAARQRFGSGSDEAKAVREAWAEVGVRWE